MRNITITVPDDVARWARIWSAQHDTSLSAMVSLTLREKMEAESAYEQALGRFLSSQPVDLSAGSTYPDRDQLYDR